MAAISEKTAITRRKVQVQSNFERTAFMFMRLSGIALLILAVGHMLLQHVLNSSTNLTIIFVAEQWNSWGWKVFDILLLAFTVSHGINGFRNVLTRESVTDVGCAIRVFRAECTQSLPVFKGMHRFLPTLFRMQGYSITEMAVNHRPRTKGKTKYGIHNRLWVGLADTFAVRWMRWRMVFPRVRMQEDM